MQDKEGSLGRGIHEEVGNEAKGGNVHIKAGQFGEDRRDERGFLAAWQYRASTPVCPRPHGPGADYHSNNNRNE